MQGFDAPFGLDGFAQRRRGAKYRFHGTEGRTVYHLTLRSSRGSQKVKDMKTRDRHIVATKEAHRRGIRPSQLMCHALQRSACLGAVLGVGLFLNAWPAKSQGM